MRTTAATIALLACSAPLMCQGLFSPQQVISTSASGATSVYAADVDGDGDFDILSSSFGDDKIAWYENTDGQGTFGAQQVISTSLNGVQKVYAADVDGDGDIDVLSASFVDDKIAWYENTDGIGTFGAQQVISTNANGARSVHAADIDGDGDIDVLSASGFDNKIAWYENTDGIGTFGAQQIISTNAASAWSVIAADVDGDGDIDVLSASGDDDKIAWYENTDGLGTFGAQQVISTNADSARIVYAADVDGDGDVDVLSASRNDDKVAWYENTDGLGTFGAQQVISTNAARAYSVYAADFDGDGDIDVLSASFVDDKIAWYENTDGQGTFGAQQVISINADGAWSVYAADVDGDGDIDVLSASLNDNKIAWYENLIATTPAVLGDGCGATAPTFSASSVISTDPSGDVEAADLDEDGDLDVLLVSGAGIAWHENTDGLGTFGAQQIIPSSAGTDDVYAADVDGDGDLDVLSAIKADDKIAWHENLDGLGSFGAQQVITAGANGATRVYAADIDGDGDVDALSASIFDNKIAWYENVDGLGTFGPQLVITTSALFCTAVYAKDIDGDGDIDALSASSFDDRIAWYENTDGLGTFGPRRVIPTNGMSFYDVYAADIDGDGDADVLSAARITGQIAWHPNINGQGTFGAQQIVSSNTGAAENVYAADLDGDGDVDVLSSSYEQVAWHENIDGLGTFGPDQVISTPALTIGNIHAADVDGDGNIDILSTDNTNGGAAWYENGGSPLTLSSNALQLGGTWTLHADYVVGATAIFYFGDTTYEPGFDLSPLGAPGCSVYTNTVLGCYPQAATGGASSMSLSVPNDPNLVGFEISAQSACAAANPVNTLTFVTSNGLRATAGY